MKLRTRENLVVPAFLLIASCICAMSPAFGQDIDVKSKGATGNGTTDDTTAIQNAINGSQAGDRIIFFGGTYLVTQTLTFQPGRTYLGIDGATLHSNQGNTSNAFFIGICAHDVAISGLTFDGGGISFSGSSGPAKNINFFNNIIQNIQAHGPNWPASEGIFTSNLTASNIHHNLFVHIGDAGTSASGLMAYRIDNTSVTDNRFSAVHQGISVPDQGTDTRTYTNVTFARNTFDQIHRMGIETQIRNIDHLYIDNNDFRNPVLTNGQSMGYSIVPQGHDIFIRNNTVEDQIPGVALSYAYEIGSDSIGRVMVTGNTVYGDWGGGIILGMVQSVTVENNILMGTRGTRVAWEVPVQPNAIIQNNTSIHFPPVTPPPPLVDNSPPCAALTYPYGNSTISGAAILYANAADNVGVTKVTFNVDGHAAGSTMAAPYKLNIDTTTLANGIHTLTATAVDGAGNSTTSAPVSVTVSNAISIGAPVITSPTTATGSAGAAFRYAITATNNPTSFSATGLPAGLSVNTSSGVISGTPTATGTSSVTIKATNGHGSGTATLTLTISAAKPAIVTQPANKTVTAPNTATFSVAATGTTPLSYQWQKTAPGSSTFSNISGATSASYTTPATAASDNGSSFRVIVSNSAGSITSNAASLTVTVNNGVPVITSAASASPNPASPGQSVSFSVGASDSDGDTLSYAWTFGDGSSGSGASVTHSYTNAGVYTATATATDGRGGSVSSSVSVTIVVNSIVNGAIYNVVNINSGKVLDVRGASLLNGAPVIQYHANGGKNQQWKLDLQSDGYYRFTAQHSGKALDVTGISTAANAPLQQWTWWGGNNQRFKVEDMGGGQYRITAKNSGLCLSIDQQSTADVARVVQRPWTNEPDQLWTLQPLNSSTAAALADTADVSPAVTLPALDVTKATGSFKDSGNGAALLSATLSSSVTAGEGTIVIIDLGGATANFTLNAKGMARNENGTIKLDAKGKEPTLEAKLTGAFASAWSDAMTGAKGTTSMNITVEVNNVSFSTMATVKYIMTKDGKASFRK